MTTDHSFQESSTTSGADDSTSRGPLRGTEMPLHSTGCGTVLSAVLLACSAVGGGANLNIFVDRAEVRRITGKDGDLCRNMGPGVKAELQVDSLLGAEVGYGMLLRG